MMNEEKKRGRTIDDFKVLLLPSEIITEILSRLPADSAIGCRGVCKQWRSLIDHPSFRDAHTRQVISSSSSNPKKFGNYLVPNSSASSSGFFLHVKDDGRRYKLEVMEYDDGGSVFSYEKSSVLWFKQSKPIITDNPIQFIYSNWGVLNISSCNGLVLMCSTIPNYTNDVFICNPFTREYVNLHTAPVTLQVTGEEESRWNWLGYMAYGFGYHPCTNEYKVVSISYEDRFAEGKDSISYADRFAEGKESKGKVSVYTLGSGKWRNKGEIPYLVYNRSHSSLFANGAIHWLTSTGKQIVSFDLADEEFRVVVPLLQPPSSLSYGDQYGVLGGCLCVVAKCESSRDIWVLNVCTTNNKEEFSWNKKFSIPWKGSTLVEPQVVTKSGKIVLCTVDVCFGFGSTLVSYDPKTEASVYENMFSRGVGKLIAYTKSFVSLKELGEEDVKSWRFDGHAQALAQQQ